MTNKESVSAWLLLLMICKEIKESVLSSPGLTFKKIRGNATSRTIENILNEEDLEYPRDEYEKFQEVRNMWADYYSCLQQLEKHERRPEVRFLLEGQHTEFQCVICPRPFQNYKELEWRYKPFFFDNDVFDLEYLDLTHEMALTSHKTLRIFNVVENLSGIYACFQKKNVLSVYILEVSKNNTMEKVFTPSIKEVDSIKLNGKEFEVNYQWTQWTECSTCGEVGRKYKYGTCFISLKKRITFQKNSNTEAKEVNESLLRRSIDISESKKILFKNSTSEDSIYQNCAAEKISKFSTGIPCASRYVPTATLLYTQKHSPLKVIVKYCLESCDNYQIFQVLDSNGKVIEVANNSAGIYSVFQKISKLSPDIERRSVTADFGKSIIIQCPGTLLRNIPVTWKINNKIIFPEIITSESKGRFTIDLINRIQIKKLRLRDSKIYSCWQGKQLVGTVNLNVEKKFRIGFDHHVILMGIVIVIGIFLLIGNKLIIREFKNRKK